MRPAPSSRGRSSAGSGGASCGAAAPPAGSRTANHHTPPRPARARPRSPARTATRGVGDRHGQRQRDHRADVQRRRVRTEHGPGVPRQLTADDDRHRDVRDGDRRADQHACPRARRGRPSSDRTTIPTSSTASATSTPAAQAEPGQQRRGERRRQPEAQHGQAGQQAGGAAPMPRSARIISVTGETATIGPRMLSASSRIATTTRPPVPHDGGWGRQARRSRAPSLPAHGPGRTRW